MLRAATNGPATRLKTKRQVIASAKQFEPLARDTDDYIAPNLGGVWQVSRNFIAVGNKTGFLCKVVITNRDIGGVKLTVGKTTIQLSGFGAVQ